ncbi:MAG TPA: alkaline phosphatase [Nitrososphaeraceae archaeon]|nr:alkaline phosphatase [Nitrososphaeraceae archaeon]
MILSNKLITRFFAPTIIALFFVFCSSVGGSMSAEGQNSTVISTDNKNDNNTKINLNIKENKGTAFKPSDKINNNLTQITNSNSSTLENNSTDKRNVIFIHPDGTTQSHYDAIRLLEVGPDNIINWDMLPNVAIYKGHLKDSLTSTSHGGATVHGSGVKVLADSYGCDGNCTDDSIKRTIMEEARDENFTIGIINSGTITEPGTGVFVSHVTDRSDHCGIVQQIVEESNATLILGAGEKYYLTANDTSFHPNPESNLKFDNGACENNMIEAAKNLGYTVVYNKTQLQKLDISNVSKVLGIFAYEDTYNDVSENELFKRGINAGLNAIGICNEVCRLYEPYAPTFDEMIDFGIKFLDFHSKKGFLLVAEEEGTDNFGNDNMNAEGVMEAGKRADKAIGIALEFAQQNPKNTLVVTAADSDAGGFGIYSDQQVHNKEYPVLDVNGCIDEPLSYSLDPLVEQSEQNILIDGITDFNIIKSQVNGITIFCEKPFLAKQDKYGNELFFNILWFPNGAPDIGGGTITRAFGCNSNEEFKGTIDNTDIPRIMANCLQLEDRIPFEK